MSLNRSRNKQKAASSLRLWIIFAVALFAIFSLFSEFVDEMGSIKKGTSSNSLMSEEDMEKTKAEGFQFQNWARTDGIQLAENIVTEIAPDVLAKNYYIILDTSGSMSDEQCVQRGTTKMDVAKQSLSQWIQNISGKDNIALMVFRGDDVEEILPLGQNTAAYKKQLLEVMGRERATGSTPLGRALFEAHNALEFQARKQLKYGEYNIVVITDGAASDRKYLGEIVGYIFKNTPIRLHTIGFCIDDRHTLNQPDYAYYVSAMNTKELAKSLQGVLAESETFDITGFEHIQ